MGRAERPDATRTPLRWRPQWQRQMQQTKLYRSPCLQSSKKCIEDCAATVVNGFWISAPSVIILGTLRHFCPRLSLDMATKVMGRSTEELGRTLGFSGNEAQQAQQATERSARNTETILYTSTAATRLMSGMSQEYFEFVRHQLEKSMERMNELWRCRTPQDIAAVQSDLMRETVGSVLESSRRVADMSLKVADDATKHMERVRPAA